MIGWILFGVLLVWFIVSMKYSHTRRLYLRNYIVYLLLSDDIRGDHKNKFLEWIRSTQATDAVSFSNQAHTVIETMAEKLSKTSTLAAHSMIWQAKKKS